VALVVGNGAYAHAKPLPSAANDANALGERLAALGWSVTTASDLEASDFERTLDAFARNSRGAEQVIFYYTGYSMEVDGENHLVPVGFDPTSDTPDRDLLRLQPTLERLRPSTGQLAVLLDASYGHDLAFEFAAAERDRGGRRPTTGTGLQELPVAPGTYLAFATTPGHTTYVGNHRNSVFARALLGYLGEDDWEIGTILVFVRDQVVEETAGTQLPWDRSALTAPFEIDPVAADDEAGQ